MRRVLPRLSRRASKLRQLLFSKPKINHETESIYVDVEYDYSCPSNKMAPMSQVATKRGPSVLVSLPPFRCGDVLNLPFFRSQMLVNNPILRIALANF